MTKEQLKRGNEIVSRLNSLYQERERIQERIDKQDDSLCIAVGRNCYDFTVIPLADFDTPVWSIVTLLKEALDQHILKLETELENL